MKYCAIKLHYCSSK